MTDSFNSEHRRIQLFIFEFFRWFSPKIFSKKLNETLGRINMILKKIINYFAKQHHNQCSKERWLKIIITGRKLSQIRSSSYHEISIRVNLTRSFCREKKRKRKKSITEEHRNCRNSKIRFDIDRFRHCLTGSFTGRPVTAIRALYISLKCMRIFIHHPRQAGDESPSSTIGAGTNLPLSLRTTAALRIACIINCNTRPDNASASISTPLRTRKRFGINTLDALLIQTRNHSISQTNHFLNFSFKSNP